MSDPVPNAKGKAVFLSYASQDAEAAARIAAALRDGGVEVWFDQNELRGGDAWDRKIRTQIKDCTLFVPIISQNTQGRLEGYFRREWRLGVDRMADMDDSLPFLVPVIVDGTQDSCKHVPERFHERQWTRLPGGDTPVAFAEWIKTLLSGEPVPKVARAAAPGRAEPERPKESLGAIAEWLARRRWALPAGAGLILVVSLLVWQPWRAPEAAPAANLNARTDTRTGTPATPRSEVGRLIERARAITKAVVLTREQLMAAAELCDRALELDSSDAKAWVEGARTDLLLIYPSGFDRSEERRKQAQARAARALSLAPNSADAQAVQAAVLAHTVGTPALLQEAEKTLRRLVVANPEDRELVVRLAEVLRQQRRHPEAAAMFERVGETENAAWCLYEGGDSRGALAAVQRSLTEKRSVAALQLNAMLQATVFEDLDAAQAAVDQILPSELLAEVPASVALNVALLRRDHERMLQISQGLTRDLLDSNVFRGPRQYFTGLAHEIAGRKSAAEAEWKAGIAVVEERLKAMPEDRELLLMQAWLVAATGDRRKAERILTQAQSVAGQKADAVDPLNAQVFMRLGRTDPVVTWLTAHLGAKPALWEAQHAAARYSPSFDKLRGDRKFETLLRETAPEGAMVFPELPAEKSKSFWSRL